MDSEFCDGKDDITYAFITINLEKIESEKIELTREYNF